MNKIKIYRRIKQVYDNLEYLVVPVIREDIRAERNILLEILEELESE